jgi:hypothetical protein
MLYINDDTKKGGVEAFKVQNEVSVQFCLDN